MLTGITQDQSIPFNPWPGTRYDVRTGQIEKFSRRYFNAGYSLAGRTPARP